MNSGVEEAKLTLQRLIGKFALLFAFIYVLMVAAGFVRVAQGDQVPVSTWLLLVLPGIAFFPAVVDAVGLHRTADQARLRTLWRRCGLLAVAGMVLLVVVAFAAEGINS
ncbi:hypothetical protein [Actinoplanes derwentensis]|uniref:Uncharacterized protein n=1 Tax=Actinoplanes derwentensis TaxID=113562 RepID=A0A1H2BRG3_9ACTN|nr:hypothetical protein [Actinoplanes derwentensis]SDT60788.1 hypothetical protein SAMN04489716_4828 [Actinoplanes derwentensis]